jgi:curved DNA-binding protein CbpA
MRDPYQALGLLPGAPGEEVKRAFRRLAKQLHPDLHPNDANADRAFRDITRAYQALTDRRSRVAYEAAFSSHHRSQIRQGFRACAATTVAAFALTVGSVSAAVLWRDFLEALLPARSAPHNEARAFLSDRDDAVASASQERSSPAAAKSRGTLRSENANVQTEPSHSVAPALDRSSGGEFARWRLPQARSADPGPLASAPASTGLPLRLPDEGDKRVVPAPTEPPGTALPSADARQQAPPAPSPVRSWVTYHNAAFGFALQYPGDVFASDPSQSDAGRSFLSRDGRARLVISAAVNTSGTTLAKHRQSLIEDYYKGARFDYAPQRSTWFVLSGMVGDEIFYQRVTFSCDRRAFHAWKLVYPVAERTFYDGIVEAVHRRYRPGNGTGGRCEANRQTSQVSRPVEQVVVPQ